MTRAPAAERGAALDDCQRVYSFLRANGRTPTAREVYQAYGISKRQYYRALRWLLTYDFLTRKIGEWRFARVNARHCSCGVEITPENAVFTSPSQGKRRYVRQKCRACWRAQGAAEAKLHRQRTDNNGYMKVYRIKKHLQRQRGISA